MARKKIEKQLLKEKDFLVILKYPNPYGANLKLGKIYLSQKKFKLNSKDLNILINNFSYIIPYLQIEEIKEEQ